MSTPQFWSTPLRYLRWASHEKPAIFWSLVIGSAGPVALVGPPPDPSRSRSERPAEDPPGLRGPIKGRKYHKLCIRGGLEP
ncbi:NADH-ubiquinone oxidoreductase subunit [Penicillium maclennaniae]|uniref:NADH-ubiquinone oxidoreductase subunit n=1 Tax=Penicillium maclennaniae TaxID=1343394 RepID=UPI002540E9B5|nr:NADH-ubiquinone oxidoreductase subunit [Penicillium maclennaniae]KAJ5665140.1 NADH-ubiquinone oxidoreductase subunit [Penicillium maclennaniae]